MEDEKVWYLGERAEQLAAIYLTRRDDITITEQPNPDTGVDLLVSLTSGGKQTGRVFGVEVKALRSMSQVRRTSPDADEYRLGLKIVSPPKEMPFPLCLFVFVMETDDGFYRWLKQPVSGPNVQPNLFLNSENVFRILDSAAVNDIIGEVHKWYDRRMKIPA